MKVFIIIICVILGSIFILSQVFDETYESSFSRYEEILNSPVIKNGWVPAYIPKSSYQISEKHNLDINTTEMSFRYTPGDTDDLDRRCSSFEKHQDKIKYTCDNQIFKRPSGSDVSRFLITLNSDGSANLNGWIEPIE